MNVGFIGTGSMGQMLIKAFTTAGALHPQQVVASNRTPEKLCALAAAVPGIRSASNIEVAESCQTVFLAVKPRDTRPVLDEIGPALTAEHLLVALTNAFPLCELERVVPARAAKVIPSITQEACDGVTLLICGNRVTKDDCDHLQQLLAAISHPQMIDEGAARVCADLTSVAPAFICAVLQGLTAAAASRPGAPAPEQGEAMVRLMMQGVGRLLGSGHLTCADVVRRVAVPGGLTAAGLKVLEPALSGLWDQVLAATARSEQEHSVSLS